MVENIELSGIITYDHQCSGKTMVQDASECCRLSGDLHVSFISDSQGLQVIFPRFFITENSLRMICQKVPRETWGMRSSAGNLEHRH